MKYFIKNTGASIFFFLFAISTSWGQSNKVGAGTALDFDGADDRAEVSSSTLLNIHNSGEITYELWFEYNGGSNTLLHRGNSANCLYEPAFLTSTILLSGCSLTGEVAPISPRIGMNHLAVVFSESVDTAYVYLNGTEVGKKSITTIKSSSDRSGQIFSSSDNDLEMGARDFDNSGTFQDFHVGLVDEVRIWDRPLTQAQVRENMCQKMTGNEPGLVAYWRFDEGVDNSCSGGQDICDASGNGHHGNIF